MKMKETSMYTGQRKSGIFAERISRVEASTKWHDLEPWRSDHYYLITEFMIPWSPTESSEELSPPAASTAILRESIV